MTGNEYKLVHSQPPILYIIRKQYRQSPESGKLSRVVSPFYNIVFLIINDHCLHLCTCHISIFNVIICNKCFF